MLVFALLTLLVKEDAAVYVAVIGLYLILSDRSEKTRALGAVIFGAACVYFFAVCAYLNNSGLGIMEWRYKDYMYRGGGAYHLNSRYGVYKSRLHLSNLFTGEKLTFTVQTLGVTRRYTACKQEDSTLYITDTVCTGKSYADLFVSALDLFPVRFRLVRSCHLAFHNEYVRAVI